MNFRGPGPLELDCVVSADCGLLRLLGIPARMCCRPRLVYGESVFVDKAVSLET